MKIVFMGTPAYATTILKALVNDPQMDVTLLVTQEDKPVGRKQVLTAPDTKAYVNEHALHVKVYQPKTLRTQEAYERIAAEKPDFIVVAAYGKILPKAILDIAPCINLHASLLPQYRGASPIQSMILANDFYAGVSAMLMEEGLDTGAVLGLQYIKTGTHDAPTLFEVLSNIAATLTLNTLKHYDKLLPLKQVSADASHCKKIKKEDGEIEFQKSSADEIVMKFRAFTPWPGIFLSSGLKLLSVHKSNTVPDGKPGTIVALTKEALSVTCKQGCIDIEILQPASKSAMKAREYCLGKRLTLGDTLA